MGWIINKNSCFLKMWENQLCGMDSKRYFVDIFHLLVPFDSFHKFINVNRNYLGIFIIILLFLRFFASFQQLTKGNKFKNLLK